MKKSATNYQSNDTAYNIQLKENFGAFSIGAAVRGCKSCNKGPNIQVAGVS